MNIPTPTRWDIRKGALLEENERVIQSLTVDSENVATTTVTPVYGADEGGNWSANALSLVVGGRPGCTQ